MQHTGPSSPRHHPPTNHRIGGQAVLCPHCNKFVNRSTVSKQLRQQRIARAIPGSSTTRSTTNQYCLPLPVPLPQDRSPSHPSTPPTSPDGPDVRSEDDDTQWADIEEDPMEDSPVEPEWTGIDDGNTHSDDGNGGEDNPFLPVAYRPPPWASLNARTLLKEAADLQAARLHELLFPCLPKFLRAHL